MSSNDDLFASMLNNQDNDTPMPNIFGLDDMLSTSQNINPTQDIPNPFEKPKPNHQPNQLLSSSPSLISQNQRNRPQRRQGQEQGIQDMSGAFNGMQGTTPLRQRQQLSDIQGIPAIPGMQQTPMQKQGIPQVQGMKQGGLYQNSPQGIPNQVNKKSMSDILLTRDKIISYVFLLMVILMIYIIWNAPQIKLTRNLFPFLN